MLSSRKFWTEISEAPEGNAALLLVVLTSWRYIDNYSGQMATDLAEEAFEGVCDWILEGSPVRGRLDTTTVGAYFGGRAEAERASELIVAQFPLEVSGLEDSLSVEVDIAIVERTPGTDAEALYLAAQAETNNLWRTVPKRERHKGLTATWQEALAGP